MAHPKLLIFMGILPAALAGAAQVRGNESHVPNAPRQMRRPVLEKNEISAQRAKELFARQIMASREVVKSGEVSHEVAKVLTPELLQRIRNLADWEVSIDEQLGKLKLMGIDMNTTPDTPFHIEGIAYRTALEESRYRVRQAHTSVLADICRALTGAKGLALNDEVACHIQRNWYRLRLLRDGVALIPGENPTSVDISPKDILPADQTIQGMNKKPGAMSDLHMYFQLAIRGDEKAITPNFATMVDGVYSAGDDLDAPIGKYLAVQMNDPEDANNLESVTNAAVVKMSGPAAFKRKAE